jgi:hypothetical protein
MPICLRARARTQGETPFWISMALESKPVQMLHGWMARLHFCLLMHLPIHLHGIQPTPKMYSKQNCRGRLCGWAGNTSGFAE